MRFYHSLFIAFVIIFCFFIKEISQEAFAASMPSSQKMAVTKDQKSSDQNEGLDTFQHVEIPKPTGIMTVGTKPIHVEDSSRFHPHSRAKRHWMIQAFFPTNPPKHASPFRVRGTYPYAPLLLQAGDVRGTFVEAYASPYSGVTDQFKGGFPVIIFAPALSYGRFDYTYLAEEFASYGFIVLIMETPYVTSLVRYNDGSSVTPTLFDLWKFNHDPNFRETFTETVMKNYQQDLEWMLNNLNNMALFLKCTIDDQRIIVMAHAEGTAAARRMAFEDKRVAAYVEYYPINPNNSGAIAPSSPCAKPVLTIYAEGTPTLSMPSSFSSFLHFNFGKPQYDAMEVAQLLNQTVWKSGGQRNAFSDYGYLSYKIPAVNENQPFQDVLNWLFKQNPYLDNRDLRVKGDKPDLWVQTIRSYILEWLKNNNF